MYEEMSFVGKRESVRKSRIESSLMTTCNILARKAFRKLVSPLDRVMVNNAIRFPEADRFREGWIAMNFGLDCEGALSESERLIILTAAEAICERRFEYLGTGPLHFPSNIPWHMDVKSGYVWPKAYFRDIAADIGSDRYFDCGCDIKYPWELSRLQFLVTLGQAYRLTKHPRYYEAFTGLVLDWIENNPVKMGCNWSCPMDAAIRGVNLCVAAVLFKEEIAGDECFSRVLYRQLLDTGRFVAAHLECDLAGHGNTHYLSDLAGLLFLGLMLRHTVPEGNKWLHMGLSGLEKEIWWQVNDDGGSFEATLSYHRFASEILLFCVVVLEQNGMSVSSEFRQRLEKMCGFLHSYLKPGGIAPVLGDADDSRFIILSGFGSQEPRDHRHILGIAGMLFERSDFYEASVSQQLDSKWLFGSRIPRNQPAPDDSPLRVYSESGFVRFLQDDVYLLIRCGPVGTRGTGSHDHNDQLSFELNIGGCDVIIDSGTFTYTGNPALRQQYRSVAAHNVMQYGDCEPNVIRNRSLRDLFCMHSSNPGVILKVESTGTGFIFCGQIRLGETDVLLQRTITLNTLQRMLMVSDVLIDACPDVLNVNRLHLSPEIRALEVKGDSAFISTGAGAVSITVSGPITPAACCIAPSYGVVRESSRLQWDCRNDSQVVIRY